MCVLSEGRRGARMSFGSGGPERIHAWARRLLIVSDRLEPIRQDNPDKDPSLGPIALGETLRRLRAIAVLEKVGTPESRRVLEQMATGLEGARETCDAKAALRRRP